MEHISKCHLLKFLPHINMVKTITTLIFGHCLLVLFKFYVGFNNLSFILQQCLNVTGSSMPR